MILENTRPSVEVKDYHKEVLSRALADATANLMHQLEGQSLPEYVRAVSTEFSLHQELQPLPKFQVEIILIKQDDKFALRVRVVPSVPSDSSSLSYEQVQNDCLQTTEVAMIRWVYRKNPISQKAQLYTRPQVAVQETNRNLGLGTTLFEIGDTIKLSIAQKIAVPLKATTLVTEIQDRSTPHEWTSRRIHDLLRGYRFVVDPTEVKGEDGNSLYRKIEPLRS